MGFLSGDSLLSSVMVPPNFARSAAFGGSSCVAARARLAKSNLGLSLCSEGTPCATPACLGWKSCAVKGNAGKGSLGSTRPWAAAISVIVDLSPWMCG